LLAGAEIVKGPDYNRDVPQPHPEHDASLLQLLNLTVRQMALDHSHKIMSAAFTDHRDSFHHVMAYIPSAGFRPTELAKQPV